MSGKAAGGPRGAAAGGAEVTPSRWGWLLVACGLAAGTGAAGLYIFRKPFGLAFWISFACAFGGTLLAWAFAGLLIMRAAPIWRKVVGAALLLTFVLMAGAISAILAAPERLLVRHLAAAAWREDVDFLVDQLNALHPRPYQFVARNVFDQAAEELRVRLPALDNEGTVLEIMRLVTLLQDGHTIPVPLQQVAGFRAVPIRLESFADGWRVIDAPAHLRGLVGRRVVSIGRMPTEELFRRVVAFVPHDNELHARSRAPLALSVPRLLRAVGAIDSDGPVPYHLATDDGRESSVDIRPVSLLRFVYWLWRVPAPITEPLYLSNTDDRYWFTLLKPSGTLYLQFNEVRDKPEESFADFGRGALRAARENRVRLFVIDLRHNGGGDHTRVRQFVEDLSRDDYVNQRGRLYVIIGRHTFSAATTLVTWLEYRTKAIFVGEPTAGRPNHPGDAEIVGLPNSRMRVRVWRIFWQHSLPEDDRPWHAPDVPVELTYQDYKSRRDPALETILSHEPKPFPDVQWSSERVRQLEGEYGFDVDKKLWVRLEGGRLRMSVDGFLQLDLHPAGDNTLLTDRDGISVSFQSFGTGPVRRLTLYLYGKRRILERR